jgi:hypothetical protein
MNDKLQPVLIGGVVLGVLSGIPFVNLGNMCCCAWAVLGGFIAAYLYIKRSPTPVRIGEGALLGVMAGLIGTLIAWVIGIPLNLIIGDQLTPLIVSMFESIDPRQGEILRQQIEQAQNKPFIEKLPEMILGMAVGLAFYAAFSTAGGMIGTAIFEKRASVPDVPPPPPTY